VGGLRRPVREFVLIIGAAWLLPTRKGFQIRHNGSYVKDTHANLRFRACLLLDRCTGQTFVPAGPRLREFRLPRIHS
jgi:hypothetical protein